MAGMECQECHGQVQDTMTVARRVAELNMGWCLDCHEEHPSVDENYGSLAELRRAEMRIVGRVTSDASRRLLMSDLNQ